MIRKDNKLLNIYEAHKDKISALEGPDKEKNDINLVSKSSNTKSCARNILSKRILLNELFRNEWLSFEFFLFFLVFDILYL